jgi:hypothetical protein
VRKAGSRGQGVLVEEPAEAVVSLDARRWRAHKGELPRSRIGRLEVERAVRPVAVVVVDEDPQDALEMASVHDQQPVEALGTDGADEALRDRVRLRRSHRRLDDLNSLACEGRVEACCELAVAVADQEPRRRRMVSKSPDELAGLLGVPRRRSGWLCSRRGGRAGRPAQ